MTARIRKVQKDHGGEIGIAALVVGVIVGYAYWGSVMISREQLSSTQAHPSSFAQNL